MNVKSMKNYAAALAVGAATLGGTLVKVPNFEARQAQKVVAEAAKIVKKRQAEFTRDSIAFSTKKFKTAADSAALDESRRALISAQVKELSAFVEEGFKYGRKNEYGEKNSNLIEAAVEDGAYALYEGWKNLSDKTTKLYNNLIK